MQQALETKKQPSGNPTQMAQVSALYLQAM
jgi:hypothetical protein